MVNFVGHALHDVRYASATSTNDTRPNHAAKTHKIKKLTPPCGHVSDRGWYYRRGGCVAGGAAGVAGAVGGAKGLCLGYVEPLVENGAWWLTLLGARLGRANTGVVA